MNQIETYRRLIAERCTEAITVRELAAQVGGSVFHLQRAFKQQLGITPKQYQIACRLQALKKTLQTGSNSPPSITQAIYDSGFGSSSRVYEGLQHTLGMTPRQYQTGGAGLAISHAFATTRLGLLLLGATDRGLCFAQFGEQPADLLAALQAEYPKATHQAMPAHATTTFDAWISALNDYLSGGPLPTLPLDVQGTTFQIKVWQYLQRIPAGTVQTYTQVAQAIGHPNAVRAAASACAANTVALLIPCHRVLRGDGGLGGYRWGLARKAALLDLEKLDLEKTST